MTTIETKKKQNSPKVVYQSSNGLIPVENKTVWK